MMFGQEEESWTRLAAPADAGAQSIVVAGEATGWAVGDAIVVTSTSLGSEKDCTMARGDQCEAEDEERAKRDAARDRGEDVEEDAPAPKRTRIDFADPAEDEAEVDPNDDPALHAGL